MKIQDFKPYFEKSVKITLNDGKTLKGIITGIENGFDTNSGHDEIELDIGSYYEGIEIQDIKAVAFSV